MTINLRSNGLESLTLPSFLLDFLRDSSHFECLPETTLLFSIGAPEQEILVSPILFMP